MHPDTLSLRIRVLTSIPTHHIPKLCISVLCIMTICIPGFCIQVLRIIALRIPAQKKMLFNGKFFFCLHKAKKGQKIFFAKSLRIVQFGEKSNKFFFVGLAFKAKTILAQGSKGLFYDENPFLSIKYSLYSNIRHTSFLKFFILYSNAQ